MGYPQQGNLATYFRPVMVVAHNDTRPACAMDIGASTGDHGDWVCIRPCTVKQIQFALTLELAGGTSVAPTVIFQKYLISGSSSGATAMGTLTIPDATAVGITVYKNITPVDFKIGQCIHLSWTIGTGTPTGQGDADVMAELHSEVPGNNTSMLASA